MKVRCLVVSLNLPPVTRLCGIARATREPVRRLLLTATAGVIVAGVSPVIAGAGEFPTLAPGGSATVAGAHVSCSVTATSVSCKKAGGLTATLVKSGTVGVARGSRTLFSTVRPRQLHANNGFVLASQDIYCHVYVVGAPILTCSLLDGVQKTHGFDMSDHSVVVFVYDTAGSRHDVKTFAQP